MMKKKILCILIAAAMILGTVPAAAFADDSLTPAADRSAFAAAAGSEAVLIQEEGYEDWIIPVDYSGALTGENELVSATLCTSDPEDEEREEEIFSEIIAQGSESGSAEIVIPGGLAAGEYILLISSELRNADGQVTESGEPVRIFLTVTERTGEDAETPDNDAAEGTEEPAGTDDPAVPADPAGTDEPAGSDETSGSEGSLLEEDAADTEDSEDKKDTEETPSAEDSSGKQKNENDPSETSETKKTGTKKKTDKASGKTPSEKAKESKEAETEEEPDDGSFPAVADDIPEDVQKALNIFTKDLAEFSEVMDMSKVTQIFQRFGGIGSFASGCVAVLEAIGIIPDPRTAGIDKILTEEQAISDKLGEMDTKLNKITDILISMAANQEEKDRQLEAQQLLAAWTAFNTNYREKMKHYVDDYEDKINTGIMNWWEEQTHAGVRILYTEYDGERSLTYSKEDYGNAFPKKADNGETILTSESIGIPSECMPKTNAESFNIKTYKKRLNKLASKAILSAADKEKLDASADFYKRWKALSDEEKKAAADEYAEDLQKTVVYHISCQLMTKNSGWVTKVVDIYEDYCDNILSTNSGINALINAQYMTHGFEGEVKDDIAKLCDSMAASAGYFGMFALSIAGQDGLKTDTYKKNLRQLWADTVNKLDAKKDTALTGKDNYCYIVGAAVDFTEMGVSSTMKTVYTQYYETQDSHQAYQSFSSDPWKIVDADGAEAELPGFLNDVYSLVLYHQYLCQKPKDPEEEQTFNVYLGQNSVGIPADFAGMIMTDFGGAENFSLSDALPMKAKRLIGTYFKTDETYLIDKGTGSKVKGQYYTIHDKAVYDYLDPAAGTISTSQVCAARAAYCEGHIYWWTDEAHFFAGNANMTVDEKEQHIVNPMGEHYKLTETATVSAPLYMLSLSSVSEEEIPEDSPLRAFDGCSVMKLPEEEKETPVETKADWSAFSLSVIDTYDADDDRIDRAIAGQIDYAVDRAEREGVTVTLSDAEKAQLAAQIREKLFLLQSELESNGALAYQNAFGIDGNNAAELSLAAKVLPAGYLTEEDQSAVSPDNMTVMAQYEPMVWLRFEKKNDKTETVLDPAFDIDPMLVIWDSEAEEFIRFEINDEIMTSLGLQMSVRIPAGSAEGRQTVTSRHYDQFLCYQLLEEKKLSVQGSGTDRYASMTVKQCSPFELVLSDEQASPTVRPTNTPNRTTAKTSNVRTGDENSMTLWILLFFAALAALVPAVCAVRKKER